MCDPLTIAAMAAMAGGSYMQSKANRQVANKRKEYTGAEIARQQQMNDKAKMLFDKSLEGQQQPLQQKNLEDAQNARKDILTKAITNESGSYLPSQDSAPAVVRMAMDQKAGEADAYARQQADAMARMGGYDDLNIANLLGFTRSGETANNLGRSMANSANILPLELQSANSAGSKSRSIGDLLTGAGQIASMGSMAGAGPSWGSLFGSNINGPGSTMLAGKSLGPMGGKMLKTPYLF